MNDYTSLPRRGPEALARRERILTEFKHSGLSAYAFARQYPMPYTTLVQWLRKRPRSARSHATSQREIPKDIAFTEVQLPTPPAQPLLLELGSQARIRLSCASQMPLAVQLIKLLQA